jgi:hypothetical protein
MVFNRIKITNPTGADVAKGGLCCCSWGKRVVVVKEDVEL